MSRFLVAFNRGNLRQPNLLIAPRGAFRSYVVGGAPGARAGAAASDRSTLIPYFARRHSQSERLDLVRFGLARRSSNGATFWLELLRGADDIEPAAVYTGNGAVSCPGRRTIAAWAMRPNTEPTLPAPQSYSETCRLVGSWCGLEPSSGGIPASLRRPLRLPEVERGGACPTSAGRRFDNGQFRGVALGEGPVRPLVAESPAQAEQGIVVLRPSPTRPGWYVAKSLWFSRPDYRGPVFIRGRQLGGPRMVAFGGAPSLVDPQIGPGATLNGSDGWRQWPGGTWLRSIGCYAWQVDGADFSHVIVFKAVL